MAGLVRRARHGAVGVPRHVPSRQARPDWFRRVAMCPGLVCTAGKIGPVRSRLVAGISWQGRTWQAWQGRRGMERALRALSGSGETRQAWNGSRRRSRPDAYGQARHAMVGKAGGVSPDRLCHRMEDATWQARLGRKDDHVSSRTARIGRRG